MKLIENEINGTRYGYGEGYFFLRDLESGKVLTALYGVRKERVIVAIISSLKSFSEKWQSLVEIKGLNVECRSN